MRRKHIFYYKKEVPIEYSIVGEGVPVLVMHGGHSNCDEEFGYDDLTKNGYSLITPSRAGYGGTSHLIGTSIDSACKAYVALLDHLQIDKVHVIAISAGGPSGIYFASRFPDRVRCLILQSAVSTEWLTPKNREYIAAQILFRPSLEKFIWSTLKWMSNVTPEFIFNKMALSFSKLSFKELRTHIDAEDIEKFRRMLNRQRSGHGFLIDVSQTKTINSIDLQTIHCPTLVMHSKNDNAVPIDHAYHAHQNIHKSELCLLDSWGHLIWLGKGAEKVNHVCSEFMCKY
ncbi:hydrolase [Cohnella kolymensis]|uniref:Hydrolase n=1 Tax=Cohnella kolymensis TaxID=1590652 RepID=A0ABR5A3B1_9BACL|nr:alpha/beta hydrolase [Cohnella kolymensis]KIL35536.1 hydrolase [Cohnella kolymensis]